MVWAIGTENFSVPYDSLVIVILVFVLRPQQIIAAISKIIYEVQCINSALCAFLNDTNGQISKYLQYFPSIQNYCTLQVSPIQDSPLIMLAIPREKK